MKQTFSVMVSTFGRRRWNVQPKLGTPFVVSLERITAPFSGLKNCPHGRVITGPVVSYQMSRLKAGRCQRTLTDFQRSAKSLSGIGLSATVDFQNFDIFDIFCSWLIFWLKKSFYVRLNDCTVSK
jgi:hypothetical protein